MRMKKQNKPVILSLVLECPAFNLKKCARAKERSAFFFQSQPCEIPPFIPQNQDHLLGDARDCH